jgi:hypothetical protein
LEVVGEEASYQIVFQTCLLIDAHGLWRAIPEQRLLFLVDWLTSLKIAIYVASVAFLRACKEHKVLRFHFRVIHFDGQLSRLETDADLAALFPQLRVKRLRKCEHSVVANWRFLVHSDDVVGARV